MAIIISEANPSGSTRSYGADWFEVTNTGTADVDITGWSIDDNSHLFANAVPFRGVKIIPAGKSVVFLDAGAPVLATDTTAGAIATAAAATATADAVVLGKFQTAWFGDTTTKVPALFLFGFYGGTGVGLSGTADEVNIFDKNGAFVTGISFGAAAVGVAPAAGQTFDNAAGNTFTALPITVTTPNVSDLSVVGVKGAFLAADGSDIGSPGKFAATAVTPPAVNLSVSSNAGSETAKSVVTVTATAASAVTTAQTVALAVTGTGITTGDYTLSSPTITIAAGATTGTATFTVVDDTLVEGTETATLTISSPSSGITLGSTVAQNIVITDNDVAPVIPAVNLSVSSTAASETAKSVITVTATAASAVTTAQTVALGVTGTDITAGDYTLSSPTITIAAGATTGSATFTVVDDTLVEATETAVLTISNPSSGITLGSTVAQNIVITDNDVAPVIPAVNLSVSSNAGSETGKSVITVTATAACAVTTAQTVALAVTGTGITTGDYTLSSPTITIAAGQTTGTATFTVVDDILVEGTETAILTISSPSSGITLGTTTTQNIVITDNDVAPAPTIPAVNLSVSSNAGSETAKSVVTVTATAASAVTTAQTVALAVTGTDITAGDYTLSSPTITIAAGATTGTATFTVVDDTLVEATETAILTISSPSSGITLGTTTTQNIVITDNDVAPAPTIPVVNLSVSSNAGSETAKSVVTVTATAASAVTTAQTLALGVTGTGITTGDYTLSSPTITIAAGATTGTATFTVVDDAVVEGTETATLTISNPSSGITLGSTVAQNIVITDNDVAPVIATNNTSLDLSKYVQVGRYDLPEPSHPGEKVPTGSLLAQEVSAVTYNFDTDTLFVVGDGSTSIVQVTKKGVLIDSMTLAPGSSPQGTTFYDVEGLTYIGGGKFVLQEERDRQANQFTYVPNATLYRDKTVDSTGKTLATGGVQSVKLGTTVGNIGTEGITYDPFSKGFVLVKESGPEGIFQTTLDFAAGTASNGSPTTVNSVNLFDPALLGLADLADVYSISSLSSKIGTDDYDHLLVLSQESGKVVNIDRTGKIYSTLTIDVNANGLTTPLTSSLPTDVASQSHEGITLDKDGFLYITSENGGGDISKPQLWVYAPTTATIPNKAPTAVVLNGQLNSIAQTTSTATAIKVADISIVDDGKGTNNLTLTGADASAFEITNNALFLKAGTTLNSLTKASYNATVNVDDPTVGSTPDAIAAFTLGVTAIATPASKLVVSEVSPWSSGNSAYLSDWFELTNTGTTAIDITGWKFDDNSNSFGSAVALRGVTSIAAGKSVVFIENSITDANGVLTTPDTTLDATFRTTWFGTTPPADLVIGNYGGSGVGLSTGGDAVNIYNASGTLITGINFVASTTYFTFDNAAGLGTNTLPSPSVTALSTVGTNGTFTSFNGVETGSPGRIAPGLPTLSIAAFTPTATETDSTPGIFRVTSDTKATTALTVNYTVSGTATNGVDYTRLLGTATIAPGQSSVDISLVPNDDALSEGNEAVNLTLATGTGYLTSATKSAATVTIIDNEPTPVGSTGADILIATPGGKFDGQGNTIFTGDGNDEVDLSTSSAAGGNRIDLGNGNDIIYVSINDIIFGGNGNDTFDATSGLGGNRMSGDAGNDIFYLGKGDRALGGAGNDKFYVQSGGSNLLSGGAGNDQFWLASGQLPDAPNTILDFQIGTDVIGFAGSAGLGINATTIKLNQVGNDTNILLGTQVLGVLSNTQSSQLNTANQSQFVFA